jgi:drug/metabolite transporter (DMT)-like permease
MKQNKLYPIGQALAAAVLFGASAPLAKILLGEIEPIPLAAFLYLGTGIGLLLMKIIENSLRPTSQREANLKRSDLAWLAGAILAGGVAAPIILLFSLKNTPAATASLLLNFEGVATTLLAALAFKESISGHGWRAIGLITTAGIILSANFSGKWGLSAGALGIMGACLLWGLDNNLTRQISAKDPITIVTIKGLAAGSFSLLLALTLGNRLPSAGIIARAMGLGWFSYGLSIVLFIHAMRSLGSARTSALFGIAPLAGMLLSFILFRVFPTWMFAIGLVLMVIGTMILVSEEHEHDHEHEMMVHDHAHHHDKHHEHEHKEMREEKHAHEHQHETLVHAHDHLPDLHHRHNHRTE